LRDNRTWLPADKLIAGITTTTTTTSSTLLQHWKTSVASKASFLSYPLG